MVYSHIKYSDKPFMGSVTAPERAQDSVEMAKIALGDQAIDPATGQLRTMLISLINANSPMTFDDTMLGALKVYARANQATIVTPFILAGAMSPVTVAGTAAQTLAESMAGMTLAQLVNPGAPVVFGSFAASVSMQSGAPTFGTPEPALVLYVMASLARRLGVPFRSGGGLCGSKISDAQAAFEAANTLLPTCLAGVNFVLHTAGWLEGGLSMGYEKFVMDADQAGMMHTLLAGVDMSDNGQAMSALKEVGPGKHFLGCDHTQANFESAFYRSPLTDNNSFEQWEAEGSKDMTARANTYWKRQLAEYEAPALDPAIDEALIEYMHKRKSSFADSNV
jgi:trimethylamine--corrinoid protein Co-methyltransferase